MTSLAMVTPTYAADYQLCLDLHESVLRFSPAEVVHHLVVPKRDLALFAPLRGPRCTVRTVGEVLPRRLWAVPAANSWLNPRRPYPPVRGWVMQQLVKLAATSTLDEGVVILADSDVRFVRPVTAERFLENGRLRFNRQPDAVDESLPRHMLWHRVASRLLGLPAPGLPLPDYISALNVWEPRVVLALLRRVEEVTGRHWVDALGSELHFSEYILYGVFVDEVLGESAKVFASPSMLCHSYWKASPLDEAAAFSFVSSTPAEDVAVLISAKSRTSLEVRRAAMAVFPGERST